MRRDSSSSPPPRRSRPHTAPAETSSPCAAPGFRVAYEMGTPLWEADIEFHEAIAAVSGTRYSPRCWPPFLICSIAPAKLIYVATRPPMPLLGREPGTQVFRDLDENPGDETFPGTAVVRLDGGLFFATAEALEDRTFVVGALLTNAAWRLLRGGAQPDRQAALLDSGNRATGRRLQPDHARLTRGPAALLRDRPGTGPSRRSTERRHGLGGTAFDLP